MENSYYKKPKQSLRLNLLGSNSQLLVRKLLVCGLGLLLGFVLMVPPAVFAGSNRSTQVKAGLIYKFISFIDWPEEVLPHKAGKGQNEAGQITIGVMASEEMFEALIPVAGTVVKGHKLVVKKLVAETSEVDSQKCHIIYFGESLQDKVGVIISRLDGYPVVTVSSMEKFVEHGGIIGFSEDKSRIRFAINIRAARQNEIRFRAKLLRVASQVIGVEK